MPTTTRAALRFGPFALLAGPPALYREGQLVSITPKALATLSVLVSNHGAAVSKEDLLSSVWSDTAVGEASLSQNVYTLRKLLAPDFPELNPIENVPRFGYRFTLPVSEELADETEEAEAAGKQEEPAAAGIGNGAQTFESAVPVAALPSSIRIGGSDASILPLQLGAAAPSAQFAAHKLWITAGVVGVVVIALLTFRYMRVESDAPPRIYSMVQLTANDSNNPITAASPSPDGEQIAYADEDGILLRARKGGIAHHLRSPDLYDVSRVAWYPDGLHLAVSGYDPKTKIAAIWSVSVTGDVPVLLRTGGTNALPSPDGKQIALEANAGTEIWLSGLNGEAARRLLSAGPHKALSLLVWSKDGAEVYISRHDDDHKTYLPGKAPYSGEFMAVEASSGKLTAQRGGVVLDEACLLPGNALLFSGNVGSSGNNVTSIWEATLDPRSGAFRSSPRLVQTLAPAIVALDSSRQGHVVNAVVSRGEADIYVATLEPDDAGLRNLHRFTYDIANSYPHSWTPDSSSVIFESKHTGINQLYRQAIDSHDPTQLISTPYDAAFPRMTPDGRWIFFAGGEGIIFTKLLRLSNQGGAPAEINLTRGMGQFRCPLLHGACMLRQVVGSNVLFSHLDPIRGEGKPFYSEAATAGDSDSFAVSPDGTELALVRTTGASSLIRVLKFDSHDRRLTESSVIAAMPVNAMQWSADGKGWFAEVPHPTRTSLESHALYFIDRNGKAKLLAQSIGNIFGIPSPDGKMLALASTTRDSNIWSLQ